ncbi:hypothetical protein [Ferrovibrio sp.]|uniref:hypothetical protein n=1 Tax=Ferrovibrio sp. TaxID=1917215 RepID=UPI003D0F2C55
MITYTILLPAETSASAEALAVAQEVLEAAGRRHGFGFRWRRLGRAKAQDAGAWRGDAVLATSPLPRGHDSSVPVFMPMADEAGHDLGLLNAGARMLACLGQERAAQDVAKAMTRVLADGRRNPKPVRPYQVGAAILLTI